jgi:hypothetical protein
VLEPLHGKRLAEQGFGARKVVQRDDQVEIQAHHGLSVGVHGLAADETVADAVVGQETEQPIEQIRTVQHDRFPEGRRPHELEPFARDDTTTGRGVGDPGFRHTRNVK